MAIPLAVGFAWVFQAVIVPVAVWIVGALARVLSNQFARKALLLAVYAVALVFFVKYLAHLTTPLWEYIVALLPDPLQGWFAESAKLIAMTSVWFPYKFAFSVVSAMIGFKLFLLIYHYGFYLVRAAFHVAKGVAG